MAGLYPPLRPYARLSVLAPTGAEAAALDNTAIDTVGVPQPVLMENAGRSAAMILQRLRPKGRVVGVVGSGNNGGDALVLLRTLRAWGRDVVAIVAAEHILRWLPPGMHRWSKFVRPSELVAPLRRHGIAIQDVSGLTYDPLTRAWVLSRKLAVNYIASGVRNQI